MKRISIYFAIIMTSIVSICGHTKPVKSPKIEHVIYITLDGVRWQDVFLTHRYFHKFWQKYASHGVMYGMDDTKHMEVASIPISLPSYQSQMSGKVQPCKINGCGRIAEETLPEFLKRRLKLEKKDVAIFSSWPVIGYAAEHIPGTVYTNTGNIPVYDPKTRIADQFMRTINEKQTMDYAPNTNRWDKYTFAHAMHYFKKYKPRFLWVSLSDSDDAAHLKHLSQYHQALYFFDGALDELFTTLKSYNLLSKTMVIITTDHGRGNGIYWHTHGPEYPESKRTWAFVFNGQLISDKRLGKQYHYSTLSIRPTIESVFLT